MTFIKTHPKEILQDLLPATKRNMLNEKGDFDFPDIFFIHTFHTDIIEEHKRHKGFDPLRLKQFYDEGRIYVKKKEKAIKVTDDDLI